MKRLSVAAVSAALLVGLFGGAASAQYAGGLEPSTTSPAPGGSFSIGGDGFASRAQITITMFSTPVELAVIRADASGYFSTRVTIPEDTESGKHKIEARGEGADGGTLVLTTGITVTGSVPGASGSQSMPASQGSSSAESAGLNMALWGTVAAGLLAVGVGLWVARRRQRPQAG